MIELLDFVPDGALHLSDRKAQATELISWAQSGGDNRKLVLDMELPSLLSLIERVQELKPEAEIAVLYDPAKTSHWLPYFKPTTHLAPTFALAELAGQQFAEAEILDYVEQTDPDLVRLELAHFGVETEPTIRSVEVIYLKLLTLVLYWCLSTSSKETKQ